jgi:hypothetical protein
MPSAESGIKDIRFNRLKYGGLKRKEKEMMQNAIK